MIREQITFCDVQYCYTTCVSGLYCDRGPVDDYLIAFFDI